MSCDITDNMIKAYENRRRRILPLRHGRLSYRSEFGNPVNGSGELIYSTGSWA